jgi:hypothetical protein
MLCDFNFIAGDLNYRFNSTFDDYTNRKFHPLKDFKSLDQLTLAMQPKGSKNFEEKFLGEIKKQDALRCLYGMVENYPGYREYWTDGEDVGPDENFMPTYK